MFVHIVFTEGLYSADMKKVFGEFLGTATLVAIVVGSGLWPPISQKMLASNS